MRFSIPLFALLSSVVVAGCSGPMEAGEAVPPAEQLGQSSQPLTADCATMIQKEMDWVAAAPTNEDRWIEARVVTHFQLEVTYSAARLDYHPAASFFPARLSTTAGNERRIYSNLKTTPPGDPFDPSRTAQYAMTFTAGGNPGFKSSEWPSTVTVAPIKCEKELFYGWGDANAPHMLFSVSFIRHADQMPY